MTPEERGFRILNENKKQYESENRTPDEIAVSMFTIGFQVGRHEMKEKIKEIIVVPWEKIK